MVSLILWIDFEQVPGVCDGQGILVWFSPWGGKELDMTERLNNNTGETPEKAEQLARIPQSFPFRPDFSERLQRALGAVVWDLKEKEGNSHEDGKTNGWETNVSQTRQRT